VGCDGDVSGMCKQFGFPFFIPSDLKLRPSTATAATANVVQYVLHISYHSQISITGHADGNKDSRSAEVMQFVPHPSTNYELR
jgi:hypothetical protein